MRIRLTIFSFLLSAFLCPAFSQVDADEPADPGPLRKTGCSDPEFIKAEQKAYEKLLSDRAKIDRWRVDSITYIQKMSRESVDRANRRYLETLNACRDTSCSSAAKRQYDSDAAVALSDRDKSLKSIRRLAAEKYEEAQDDYDEAVNEAIKLYCKQSYQATGETGSVVYSGTICDIHKAFTVNGKIELLGIEYPFKFVPDTINNNTGTFSFYATYSLAILQGNGTYKIVGTDTGKPKILMSASSSGTIPQGTVTGGGDTEITLVPYAGKGCDAP